MANEAMGRWLRAMNPWHVPRGMAEAQRSARTVVIGLAISLAASLAPMIWMFSGDWFVTAMNNEYAAMGLSAQEIAMQRAVMEVAWPYVIGVGLVFSALFYLALGIIQWRSMTRAIPIVLLGFAVYGVVANIGMRLLNIAQVPDMPLWVLAVTWPPAILAGVIYAAALQGAILLHRLKGQP